MKVCKVCGTPDIVARDHIWHDDGTITIKGDDRFRMGIMEVPVLLDIVDRLEKAVGPKIHEMFMEASTKYTRRYVDNLLKGPLGFVVKRTKAGAKLAYTKLLDTAVALGFGKIHFGNYEHRKAISGTVFNSYYLPLFLGDMRGSFESIEGLASKVEYQEEGNKATITVSVKEGASLLEAKYNVRDDIRLAGDIELKECKCGLPEDVKRFRWEVDRGMIMDAKTEERVVIMGLNDLTGVLNELKEEMGDVLATAFLETNKEYGGTMVKEGWVKDFDGLAKDFVIKGMANVKATETRNGVRLEIKNPFNREYVMGRCFGAFEAMEGKVGDVVKTETPGLIEMSLIRQS